jgi:DNA-binding transcriptional regulator YbjK
MPSCKRARTESNSILDLDLDFAKPGLSKQLIYEQVTTDQLNQMNSFFENFNVNCNELKAKAYNSAIAKIEKVLEVEYAQHVLNQRRVELIEKQKQRLRFMLDNRIDRHNTAHCLDEFRSVNQLTRCK